MKFTFLPAILAATGLIWACTSETDPGAAIEADANAAFDGAFGEQRLAEMKEAVGLTDSDVQFLKDHFKAMREAARGSMGDRRGHHQEMLEIMSSDAFDAPALRAKAEERLNQMDSIVEIIQPELQAIVDHFPADVRTRMVTWMEERRAQHAEMKAGGEGHQAWMRGKGHGGCDKGRGAHGGHHAAHGDACPPGCDHAEGCPKGAHGKGHGGLAMFIKELDLTADQEAALKDIREEMRGMHHGPHSIHKAAMPAVHQALAAGDVSLERLRAIWATEVRPAAEANMEQMLSFTEKLHSTLTSAQRAELVAKMREHCGPQE